MPYIEIKTTKKLNEKQKKEIKTFLGEKIGLITGKTEQRLMISFTTADDIYFRGDKQENAAFIDIKLYKDAPFGEKESLTKSIFEKFNTYLNVEYKNLYLCFFGYDEWGTNGLLK